MDSKPVKPRKYSILDHYKSCLNSAFKADAEAFLDKFQEENSFNYADFANIWQSMNFTLVFADQKAVKTLEIICEIFFRIVMKYLICESSLHKQIGSFYLLYGLYYKQPVQQLTKIRLTLEEYKQINKLMNEMATRGQYDALYIFAKMKADGAFVYVAHSGPLKISSMLAKPHIQNIIESNTLKCKDHQSSLYKFENIVQDETFQALDKTAQEYEAKLRMFAEQRPGFVPFKTTLVRDLKETYQNVFTSTERTIASEQVEQQQQQQPETIYQIRQSVRLKALANKQAEYRGSRKVLTAIDLQDGSESD